ncbi:hypothetical protein [Comamonas sp. 4034]|uniref:hypothetical protein n=1 Tax=Comamonas sp. 4034 TaxID=3156455 RepID=UPI003D1A5EA8
MWIDPWGWACIPNKEAGTAREKRVGEKLDGKFGESNVLRERYLRDANGKIVRDPKTGEARRVDFVITDKNGKGTAVEVTSRTADKQSQLDKEGRIRAAGGVYVRDPKTKKLIPVGGSSRVARVN